MAATVATAMGAGPEDMQAVRFRGRACGRCKRGDGRDHQNDLLHRYPFL